jgi:transposase
MSDKALAALLFPDGEGAPSYKVPDWEYIYRELMKPGVTQQLLWMEYCEQCRMEGEIPFQLTAFKTHYREYAAQTKATMHIKRKPGEIMEVDWAGQTAHLIDAENGEGIDAYVFVAALPYSGYAYAEAFLTRDQEAWTEAHINTYSYFGGITRMLVPDNLKTGVIKHTRSELVLNKSYQELAEHYGTAILPTRVKAPKDKATVEGSVGKISTFILAAIRNQKFFSLRELNEVIRDRLYAFNHKPFQRKEGSRAVWFADEKPALLPLPRNRFEFGAWKIATVAFNYHIGVAEQYYSVPYELIKRKVDVRLTHNVVEIFFEGSRVCSHIRLYE